MSSFVERAEALSLSQLEAVDKRRAPPGVSAGEWGRGSLRMQAYLLS
jgi:hypothetical protein